MRNRILDIQNIGGYDFEIERVSQRTHRNCKP